VPNLLIDDLRGEIAANRCIVILGAGVAIYSTNNAPCASWTGLLRDGVERCRAVAHGTQTRCGTTGKWSRHARPARATPARAADCGVSRIHTRPNIDLGPLPDRIGRAVGVLVGRRVAAGAVILLV
jgi:hypothetical protein